MDNVRQTPGGDSQNMDSQKQNFAQHQELWSLSEGVLKFQLPYLAV